jgi:hypothetical protein
MIDRRLIWRGMFGLLLVCCLVGVVACSKPTATPGGGAPVGVTGEPSREPGYPIATQVIAPSPGPGTEGYPPPSPAPTALPADYPGPGVTPLPQPTS